MFKIALFFLLLAFPATFGIPPDSTVQKDASERVCYWSECYDREKHNCVEGFRATDSELCSDMDRYRLHCCYF
uniref:Secreted protein n=1 Tax=Steinernema glaseri TaxID=37863 RepID=A0A1I7Y231_9BILA